MDLTILCCSFIVYCFISWWTPEHRHTHKRERKGKWNGSLASLLLLPRPYLSHCCPFPTHKAPRFCARFTKGEGKERNLPLSALAIAAQLPWLAALIAHHRPAAHLPHKLPLLVNLLPTPTKTVNHSPDLLCPSSNTLLRARCPGS